MRATIHELNGRLRVKLSDLNRDNFKEEEIFTLLKHKGIENISINSKNSCFTLHYNPALLNSYQLKNLLGLKNIGINKKTSRSSKATGAYIKKIQTEPKIKQENQLKEKLVQKKSSPSSNKDLISNLAKTFGETLFKTTLKETINLAIKGSVGLNLSTNIGKKLLQVK